MSDPTIPYLVHRVAARIETSVNQRTRRHGLRLQGFRVLRRLWENEPQRLGELAQASSIESSALSHLVSRMVRDGWLEKSRIADDERSVAISLTPAGRDLAAELVPLLEQYEAVCLDGFSYDEATLIRRALVRMFDNLANLDAAIDAWEAAGPRRRTG